MPNVEIKQEGLENKFNDPKKSKEDVKHSVEQKLSKGTSEDVKDVAKNLSVIMNKLVENGNPINEGDKNLLKNMIEKFKESNCMNEAAKQVANINNVDAVKFVVKNIETTDTNSLKEISNSFDTIVNKVGESDNEFSEELYRKVKVNNLSDIAKKIGNIENKKIKNEIVNDAINTNSDSVIIGIAGELNSLKLGVETTKNFIEYVYTKGSETANIKVAENLKGESLKDQDTDTIKSFANEALKKHKECVKEIANNSEMMNKLDEDTKNKIKQEADSEDKNFDTKLDAAYD